MKKNVIVSLADVNYFPLLEELVDSIKRFKESEKVAICILDAGLTQEQKERVDPKRAKADVKKKDKTEVIPKTKEYESIEKAIKEKGAPLLLKGAEVSKGQGPNTYILTTSDGKSIKYQDFTGKSDELIAGKHDIQLRLVEPVAGQANVVKVNGKLYFQFKTVFAHGDN